jgi:hypothetical protein
MSEWNPQTPNDTEAAFWLWILMGLFILGIFYCMCTGGFGIDDGYEIGCLFL